MRPTTIFFPLILTFAIQFALVHTESITGTWSNPTTTSSSSNICCIPDSITISLNSLTEGGVATYNIGAMYMNRQCLTLFGSVTSATIDLSYMGPDYYYGTKYSQMALKAGYFYDQVGSSGKLRISSDDSCDFTMNTKTGGGSKSSSGAGSAIFLFIFCTVACIIFSRTRQRKVVEEGPILVQPNFAQQNMIYSPPTSTVYKGANNTYVDSNFDFKLSNEAYNAITFSNNASVSPNHGGYGETLVAPGDAAVAYNSTQRDYAPARPQFGVNGNAYAPYYNN